VTAPAVPQYTKKDFTSDQVVRWCPGCGDYSILSNVQSVLAEIGVARENIAVISGIGCSSRFPYYLSTYGFHTIHGRAPAFATGLKVSRPELSVWVATGDGDALSIGGNHFIHLLRRNVDLNILMFNNRIYGLTKGQYSPTSEQGKKTKSSPMGSVDRPFEPLSLALGSGGTFVARSVDVFADHIKPVLHAAQRHHGTSFVEIYQNCNIFNDGAFEQFTDKVAKKERVLYLQHGQPLVWGSAVRRGLVMRDMKLEVVELGDTYTEADCAVHDEHNRSLAMLLAAMDPNAGFPVAVGVFYQIDAPTYEDGVVAQAKASIQKLGTGDLARLLGAGDTWTHT
jgi:2-oxoglutarate ferredoxin oxidoreductase subunit beta